MLLYPWSGLSIIVAMRIFVSFLVGKKQDETSRFRSSELCKALS